MSKRLSNMEALRLVAMFMVIVLHYLDKGGLLTSSTEPFGVSSYMAWFVESFAIVAVNAYVLITGYFMCKSNMKLSRLLEILLQVMWYALLVPVVFMLAGAIKPASLNMYDILQYVFPIHTRQYWFVTAYVQLMLFVPIINLAVKHMDKKQFLTVTCLITALEVLPKSILPARFALDEAGNNVMWLICLYLIGAYIRTYGIPFFSTWKKSFITYVLGAICIFASLIVMRVIYFKIDAFGDNLNFGYHYNHIFCLIASIALFYTFLHIRIPEGKISNAIIAVAPYTFGVYLLHEHILVRYEWVKWLNVAPTENPLLFVGSLLWKCLLVLVIGLALDWGRAKVFGFFRRNIEKSKNQS